MTDRIKYTDMQITITHGLDDEGEPIYNVNTQGDLPYIYALGLIEAAKDNLKHHYGVRDIEDEE